MQELDRMEGTFEVEEVEPAEIVLSNLAVTPQANVGDTISCSVTFTNIGGQSGSYHEYFSVPNDPSIGTFGYLDGTLGPGESRIETAQFTAINVGTWKVYVGGATTNVLSASFTVGPRPARGHILGLMVKKAGGDWKQLGVEKLILGETIHLSVSWANDSLTHSLKGHIALRLIKPNLQEWTPTPVSGQDTIVVPGGSSYVLYEIPLDQKGTWRHYEVLTGKVV